MVRALPPARRGRTAGTVAVTATVTAAATLGGVALLAPQHLPVADPLLGRALSGAALAQADAPREREVRALLDRRAAALESRDRAAFLATVDPAAPAFRERQARLFDALEGVPAAGWSYRLDPSRAQPATGPLAARLDARHGRWWAPDLLLRYRLGDEPVPTAERQVLTLVESGGTWRVAADDDFVAAGARTDRALWDRGPVEVVRAPGVLVLGHRGRPALLEEVARTTAAALPGVRRAWGPWSGQVVVLVPRDADELSALARTEVDLSALAALAVTASADGQPVGDRVLVAPAAFDALSAAGRRMVLAHEVTHVATRPHTGPHSPAWLVEGLADVVGHAEAGMPLPDGGLLALAREGSLPAALPDWAALAPDAPTLGVAYEGAARAVDLLLRAHGAEAVVRLYRDLGRAGGERDVARAWSRLGTDEPALTAAWRADLRRRA